MREEKGRDTDLDVGLDLTSLTTHMCSHLPSCANCQVLTNDVVPQLAK